MKYLKTLCAIGMVVGLMGTTPTAHASDYDLEYNDDAYLYYESLFWGSYAPVPYFWDYRDVDTSQWGAPFNTETHHNIPGVHPEVEDETWCSACKAHHYTSMKYHR